MYIYIYTHIYMHICFGILFSFPLHVWIWKTQLLWNCMHACVLNHFSCVQFFATLWTVAHQAPLSMGFPRQEYWRGLPCPHEILYPQPVLTSALGDMCILSLLYVSFFTVHVIIFLGYYKLFESTYQVICLYLSKTANVINCKASCRMYFRQVHFTEDL